jgi:hypothetical protein
MVVQGKKRWHPFSRNSDHKDHKGIVDGRMKYVLYGVRSGRTPYLLTSFGSATGTATVSVNGRRKTIYDGDGVQPYCTPTYTSATDALTSRHVIHFESPMASFMSLSQGPIHSVLHNSSSSCSP